MLKPVDAGFRHLKQLAGSGYPLSLRIITDRTRRVVLPTSDNYGQTRTNAEKLARLCACPALEDLAAAGSLLRPPVRLGYTPTGRQDGGGQSCQARVTYLVS